uniref:Testis expressed 47 n=1 Tax=Ornithorhynchus anatinus TaxID=9258 RepID=F6PTB2_ORNAN
VGCGPLRSENSKRPRDLRQNESLSAPQVPRLNYLSVLEDKPRVQMKKFLLHRMFLVAMRIFQNALKQHLGEPVTGIALLYPSSVLVVLESSSGSLYRVLQELDRPPEPGRDAALLQGTKILVVSHDIPARLFLQWHVSVITVPVMYLEDVTQSQSPEEVVTECLTLVLKLGVFLLKTIKVGTRFPGANLHQLVPELLIPEETIKYLSKCELFMTPGQFLEMYSNPIYIHMDSESVWPIPASL